MKWELPILRKEEQAVMQLRALFENNGYRLFRMGSFEEYDLYLQNKPFLKGDDIITFTGVDGRLMALKPDVTLSIVKSTQPGQVRRVYYNENVFRRSRQTDEYRELNQMGLEFIGGNGVQAEAEVLRLAASALGVIAPAALDISHMGFIEAMLTPFAAEEKARNDALLALQTKSPHAMQLAARTAMLSENDAKKLTALAELSGPFETAIQVAYQMAQGNKEALAALEELAEVVRLAGNMQGTTLRLDFSILNDADYYNGIIFQGFLAGVPRAVLGGGRYDNLMARFDKTQGAVGFALYLDELSRDSNVPENISQLDDYLNVALPKGRLGDKVYRLFSQIGYPCDEILNESRKLIFEDAVSKVRYFLVKPSDVDIYVEHGAADIGVVGKDVLLESGADVLELTDLRLGTCKLAVAGKEDFVEDPAVPIRVATKYPKVTRSYYAAQSRDVEIINLHGSIELAPLLGLSDVIVDIVESGATLRENHLAVMADVAPSSARLIANRSSWRFKEAEIQTLTRKLEEVL